MNDTELLSRISLERQCMQQKYQDYMKSRFNLDIADHPCTKGDARNFYTANGMDRVPSALNLEKVETLQTTSLPSAASILQSQIDQLEMRDFFPERPRNFLEFKAPIFQQLTAKQRKSLPQLRNQPHKTELDGYYHQFSYESNPATENDFQVYDKQRVGTFRMVNGKIREKTDFDCNKLWYRAAQSKLEGQLFGINYDDFAHAKIAELSRAPPLERDFDEINEKHVVSFLGLQEIRPHPIVISSLEHPGDVTSQKFVKDQIQKYQKQIQAAPQEKKQKAPREKPYLEGYDKKMVCGRQYGNFNLPNILEGYKKNSSSHAYETACYYVPSLCHALVALIACQQCSVRLREEDVFLRTCPQNLITENRQALPIRDILKVIRDIYPRLIERFIKPPLKCFETIMTALLFMVSPNDQQLSEMQVLEQEIQFTTCQSLFDQRAGMPEIVHYTQPFPRAPCQPAMIQPAEARKSAIQTASETLDFEGDKNEQYRRYNQAPLRREPQQKPVGQQADQSAKFAGEIMQNIGKLPRFPVSQALNNTKVCRIEQSADNICQTLESGCQIYAGQTSFGLLYSSGGTQFFENLRNNSREILKIDTKTLYAAPEEKERLQTAQQNKAQREVNSDSEDDVAADEIPFQEPPKTAVVGMSSPLLGEFILIPGNQPPDNTYFGVNNDQLARIATVFNYQCELDRYEIITARQRFESGEFDKLSNNEFTLRRIECLQKSKQRVLNSLEVVGQGYSDQQKYHFRAQERLRYFLLPHTTFPYVILGIKSLSLKQKTAEFKQQSFKYVEFQRCVPQHLSKIAAVQDAICRLNGRFGTREDIMERCCDSNFYSWKDPRLQAKVSCALDRLRLHFVDQDKKMRLAMFDQKNKIWMLASTRLQAVLGDYQQEEWPSDLYDMYQRGNRGVRPLGR